MKIFIYLLLIVYFLPVQLFAIEGRLLIDRDNIKAGEPFDVILEVSYDHGTPAVLKGAPVVKSSEEFKQGKVSSFSKSGTAKNLIFYKYSFKTDKIGSFTIGPAIVTYFTKTDPKKKTDEGLSLAEITKKAVEGEKQVDTHTFLVNEIQVDVKKISYLFIIYIVAALLLVAAVITFIVVKIKKAKKARKARMQNTKIDFAFYLREIEKLKNDGNYGVLYEKLTSVAKKAASDKVKSFEEKLESIKFASYSPDAHEVERDIRSLEQFIKSKEGEC